VRETFEAVELLDFEGFAIFAMCCWELEVEERLPKWELSQPTRTPEMNPNSDANCRNPNKECREEMAVRIKSAASKSDSVDRFVFGVGRGESLGELFARIPLIVASSQISSAEPLTCSFQLCASRHWAVYF